MKKVLLLLVLSMACAAGALADQITFSFIAANNTFDVKAAGDGLTMGPALNVLVSDSTTGASFPLLGADTANTGAASSFLVLTSPDLVVATYNGAGADSVLIKDGMGNVLLSGEMQDRSSLLAGYPDKTGAFLGNFTVDFVSPEVLKLFGLNSFSPVGAFSATFGQSRLQAGPELDAVVGGGSITIQAAPVPEPQTWTLLLLGAGLLGMRKFHACKGRN